MIENRVLDVREIDKSFRKKIILNLFNELDDGQQLILISNHNLAPLNKLFQKQKHGFFEWHDLQNGPDIWRISITKTNELNLTINDILKRYPMAIHIFENRSISYFNLGNEQFDNISADAKEIYEEIKQSYQPLINPLRTDSWSISFTVDYINNNHHTFVRKKVPELEDLIDHLVAAHAATHPQLPMIKERFMEFKDELNDHLVDEENIVFPSYKSLDEGFLASKKISVKKFDDAINWMKEDHILAGTSLKTLRNFCNNYIAPANSSPGFKILYEELKRFEYDMHFHMYLENNVLFAKVVKALRKIKDRKS